MDSNFRETGTGLAKCCKNFEELPWVQNGILSCRNAHCQSSEGCWGWVGCRAECLTHDVVCRAGPPLVGHFQESPPSLPLHTPWNYTPVFFHPGQCKGSLVVWGADSEESRFGLLYYKVGIVTGKWTDVEIVTSVKDCTAGPVARCNRSKLGV